jgi:hypothetical protein
VFVCGVGPGVIDKALIDLVVTVVVFSVTHLRDDAFCAARRKRIDVIVFFTDLNANAVSRGAGALEADGGRAADAGVPRGGALSLITRKAGGAIRTIRRCRGTVTAADVLHAKVQALAAGHEAVLIVGTRLAEVVGKGGAGESPGEGEVPRGALCCDAGRVSVEQFAARCNAVSDDHATGDTASPTVVGAEILSVDLKVFVLFSVTVVIKLVADFW